MRKILLLLILFTAINCKAQQRELDSLLNELKKHPQDDTMRLNLLNGISHAYEYTNADSGLKIGFEAALTSERLKNLSQLCKAYYNIACNYNTLGKDSIALIYCNKSLTIRKQLKDSFGAAIVYHLIGIIYSDFGDYITSIKYQQLALNILKKINQYQTFGDILNSLGVNYQELGDYPRALDYFNKALVSYEKANKKSLMAYAYGNMGSLYQDISDFPKAILYAEKSIALYKDAGDKIGISDQYNELGITYDLQSDTTNSRTNFKKSIAIAIEIKYEEGIVAARLNLGISYYNDSDYNNALHFLNQDLIEKLQHLNDQKKTGIALTYLAAICMSAPDKFLLQNGIWVKNKLALALTMQQKSIEISKQIHSIYNLADAYENLSDIYTAQKNYPKALNAYKQYISYKDSMFNDDKKQQITRLEMQYQFNKTQDSTKAITDKQQALAKTEIQKRHVVESSMMAGAGFLILAGIGAFAFYKRNRDIRSQRNEAELKSQITGTEMKALRAQMNPHFIFNSLNSIADYIDKNQTQTASDFTAKFARLMRMVLENSEHKEIPLADDLKALELYMQLEQFRLKNKFDYEIKVDENIDKENTLVPPLILQPFVENSIWHGIAKKDGHGNITIYIKQEGEMIHCIVEDDGGGIKETELINEEKKSLGMRITKARIEIINKIKNTNASMNVYNKEKGVRAEVKLPLEISF